MINLQKHPRAHAAAAAITNPADIHQFLYYLTVTRRTVFHPDTPFNDYITPEGKPTFTGSECVELAERVNECFAVFNERRGCFYDFASMYAGLQFRTYLHVNAAGGRVTRNTLQFFELPELGGGQNKDFVPGSLMWFAVHSKPGERFSLSGPGIDTLTRVR